MTQPLGLLAAPAGAGVAWVVAGGCLAWLAVLGLLLIFGLGRQPARQAADLLLVFSLALLAFFAVGFGLAMGGAQGLFPGLGTLAGLSREWQPRGDGWGLLGRTGFFLGAVAYDPGAYALFFLLTALLLLALAIAVAPWMERAPRAALALFALLFGGLVFPAYANWLWGGGWLARLGQTAGMGHGALDVAGAALVNGLGGLVALAGALTFNGRPADDEPAAPAADESAPLFAVLGFGLAMVGWIGISMAALYAGGFGDERLAVVATNLVAAVGAGMAVGLLYTWLVAGEPQLVAGVQAGLGALAAAATGAPFFPAWGAVVIGGVAGLLTPLAAFALSALLRDRLAAHTVAVHGLGGILGLLAVGLIADGRFGAGWNGIGERIYQGVTGQGVTGMFPGAGIAADPTQLRAQVLAAAALLLAPIVSWLVLSLLRVVLTWRPARRPREKPAA